MNYYAVGFLENSSSLESLKGPKIVILTMAWSIWLERTEDFIWDPLYVVGGHPSCFDSKSGDDSYADDGGYRRPTNPVPGDCGYYLHAHRLVLHHPTRNEVLKITAPLPSILQTREEASGGIDQAGDGSK